MDKSIIGFIIWSLFGILIIGLGIYTWFSKKPMNFWANVKGFEVNDIKKYNHALGKLFGGYGFVLILLGLPLLAGQNSAWILLSVLGIMIESVIAMIIYTLVIEKKYKKF